MQSVRAAFVVVLSTVLACSTVQSEGDLGDDEGDDIVVPDGGPAQAGCQGGGTELIYLVDSDHQLVSFDPREVGSGSPFDPIGTLDCPAGAAWPELGTGAAATPFSMSVDRQGTAWVLYSSGEVFKVSTTDATCVPSNFSAGHKGFELFGMGFVSDSEGSEAETLFIAGGPASDQLAPGNLATFDTGNLDITTVGPLSGETSPEMTGTGDGELYGFFPGLFSQFIARLDKTTGAVVEQWDLAPPGGAVTAWAFAHWGGKFYMFVTTEDILFGTSSSNVTVFDPATKMASSAVADIPYRVVGAGVSTCAPIHVE